MSIGTDLTTLYTDKDTIKQKMIELLQKYEDLDNLDMSKLNFHAYIVDVLSMLTSDNLFFSSMAYKNNFMILANLQEAIYNWAKYLSYDIPMAQPSYADSIIYFSNDFLDSDIEFIIPKYHKFYANDIVFRSDYQIVITYQNGNLSIKAIGDNVSFYIPYEISDDNVVKFPLLLNQYNIEEEEIYVSNALKPYQFQSYKIKHNDYLYKLEVVVTETDNFGNEVSYVYEPASDIYSMGANSRKYVIKLLSDSEFEIIFGNGVYGKQLKTNSVINIKKFVTKGANGRIIKGALNSMDRIYATVNGIQKVVDLRVINPTNGVGGRNMETPVETKENAIRAFRSKLSLTTEPNYKDFVKIMNLTALFQTKPILKRSDLKINEINLFHALKFAINENKYEYSDVVPTNTILWVFPNLPLKYLPFKEFSNYNNEGFDYICPFGMEIDEKNMSVSYVYYIRNMNILSNITNYKYVEVPILFKNLNIYTSSDKTMVYFDLYFEVISSQTNIDLSLLDVILDIKYPNYYKSVGQLTLDIQNNKLSGSIETLLLKSGEAKLSFRAYYNGDKFADGGPKVILLQNLDNIVYSSFRYEDITDKPNSNKIIYDIPVIEKTWWDNLTDEEKQNFEYSVIQQFLGMNLEEKRALNVRINNKFIKTIGKINNYFYNKENYQVIDIVDVLPNNPNEDDKYIISRSTVDPNLVEHKNKIAIFMGGNWIFIEPETSEMALVLSDNKKYTYTGIRWFVVDYCLNLPINMTVFVDPSVAPDDLTVKEEIAKTIIDGMVSKFGPDQPIYRSDIISLVHNRKDIGVVFCELNIIETDIIFDYNIDKDLTKQQLMQYVPEFIHINPEDMVINVKRLGNPEKLK